MRSVWDGIMRGCSMQIGRGCAAGLGMLLFRGIPALARLLGLTLSIGISAAVIGFRPAGERLANAWLTSAINAWQIPDNLERPLFRLIRVAAYFTIFMGWILLAYTTVFVLNHIFSTGWAIFTRLIDLLLQRLFLGRV